MKIISWNVNGLRAVERKGAIQQLLAQARPTVLMIQEIKGMAEQFSAFLTAHPDYQQYYSSAHKAGYAGTGLWLDKTLMAEASAPQFTSEIPQAPNADEGRLSQVSFTWQGTRWTLLSIYFPNGGKSEQAWQEKLVFYARVLDYMKALHADGQVVVVGGDMNVAHTELDLARPRENDGKIGFHPRERAWMDTVVAQGWVDVWRDAHPGVTAVYSWWHMISRGRERNVGWRIDYFLLHQTQLARVGDIAYLDQQMGSDHCPIMLTVT